MKLVKEHINEKFVEDSDPIHDMGIGFKKEVNINSSIRRHNNAITKKRNKLLNDLNTQEKNKFENRLKKQLVEKFIEGTFITESGNNIKRKIKIKNIIVDLMGNGRLNKIIIVSEGGHKYELVYWRDYKYIITSY
jgi:hypothetical protein